MRGVSSTLAGMAFWQEVKSGAMIEEEHADQDEKLPKRAVDAIPDLSLGRTMAAIGLAVGFCLGIALSSRGDPSGPVRWAGFTAPSQGMEVNRGGWGRMAQLANGDWLAVSTSYPRGRKPYLRLYASSDRARTWKAVSSVAESGRTLDNGELITLSDGTVLLTMRSLILSNSYRLPVYRSTDNGASWSYLSNIDASEGDKVGGLWEPKFLTLPDGLLAVFYSNEAHAGYSQIISEQLSKDNGASWGDEIWAVAQSGGGALRPGMPQICRMASGDYILVYEVVGVGKANVYDKISTNGVNWPEGLGAHIPCQHAGPFVTALPDGRLLVTSCENQVSFSGDFGATWQKIDPPPWKIGFVFDWPALYLVQSNQVAAWVSDRGIWSAFGDVSPPMAWPRQFAADFRSGRDENWTRYGGRFAITNGVYQLADADSYGKALTGDEFWADGELQADVRLETPGNAGLIFRASNPDYTEPDDGFDYYVGLNAGGSVVFGIQSNSWTELASAPVAIGTNGWHHLAVRLQGSHIVVHLDGAGAPLISQQDASFRRGQIGVRAFRCDAAFKNITFSNATAAAANVAPNPAFQ